MVLWDRMGDVSGLSIPGWLSLLLLVLDYGIKIVAIGVVPENRRPSSSQAWLLLILLVPVVGLPLFYLIGSPYVHGRRHRIQAEANAALLARSNALPMLPAGVVAPFPLSGAVALNRNLGSLPCVLGTPIGLFPGYGDGIAAMTEAVRAAERMVKFEIYILALDVTTEPFFDAMADAVRRGVKVRLLYDHIGSRRYPGFLGNEPAAYPRRDRLASDAAHQALPGPVEAS
jgi:cardiolipin synthase A/B